MYFLLGSGVIPADQITFDYVNARTNADYEPQYADPDAKYMYQLQFNVEDVEPLVAAPHSPDNRKTAKECSHIKTDRVYIGSCTGGKTEDFFYAAQLFHKAK